MSYSSSIQKTVKLIASNIVWICIVGYFVFHTVSGARGAISWAKLSIEVSALEKELKNLKEENAFLENKIHFFRNDNLDLDLLEELAHSTLGLVKENEVIVLLPTGG
jgi:cell division protein FtsB